MKIAKKTQNLMKHKKMLTKKISIPKVTRKGVRCNQLSANLLQILVNGEPAEKIPPGQNVTKQKQPELYNRG